MPLELALLPVIESSHNLMAHSRADAVGLCNSFLPPVVTQPASDSVSPMAVGIAHCLDRSNGLLWTICTICSTVTGTGGLQRR